MGGDREGVEDLGCEDNFMDILKIDRAWLGMDNN